jgi:ribonuclease P protein component
MLPKPKRLTKHRDFLKLAAQGHTVFGPFATLRIRHTLKDQTKVAFITSTKVFKLAVDRNRAKRRMREVVAGLWPILPQNMHLLFILKPECKSVAWEVLVTEVKRMVERIPEALLRPVKPSSRAKKQAAKMSQPKLSYGVNK